MASASARTIASLTTPAPTTAREAAALAAVLAEKESALAKAQRLASDDARFTTAQAILDTDAVEAAAERDKAVAAWQSTADDPAATLDDLLGAFVAMKSASARRTAIVAQASGVMGQIRPLRNEHSGQPQPYRYDVTDPLVLAQFGDALEGVIQARAESAASSARADVQRRSEDAGIQAASRVKV